MLLFAEPCKEYARFTIQTTEKCRMWKGVLKALFFVASSVSVALLSFFTCMFIVLYFVPLFGSCITSLPVLTFPQFSSTIPLKSNLFTAFVNLQWISVNCYTYTYTLYPIPIFLTNISEFFLPWTSHWREVWFTKFVKCFIRKSRNYGLAALVNGKVSRVYNCQHALD